MTHHLWDSVLNCHRNKELLVVKSDIQEDINFQNMILSAILQKGFKTSSDLKHLSADTLSFYWALLKRPLRANVCCHRTFGSTHWSSWGSVVRRLNAKEHELYQFSETFMSVGLVHISRDWWLLLHKTTGHKGNTNTQVWPQSLRHLLRYLKVCHLLSGKTVPPEGATEGSIFIKRCFPYGLRAIKKVLTNWKAFPSNTGFYTTF